MKKTMIAVSAVFALSLGVAQAGKVKDNCGCGLGSMALGEEEGLVSHLAATFLNGICGNQTFGITSGTLNCDQATSVVSNERLKVFVADNMDHLIMDVAKGEGASLNGLADILDVPRAERNDFNVKLQRNFGELFVGEGDDVSADDFVKNLDAII